MLSKDGFEVHKHVDHIGSSSWQGNVSVSNVVLQTCWKMGQEYVSCEFPELGVILHNMYQPLHGIFLPLGKDLVKAPQDKEDIDDTLEMTEKEEQIS